jgi:hypothetical protein
MNTAKQALSVLLCTLVVGIPTAASAGNVDEARAHFKRGTELYDEGNYRGALLEFQQAFDLTPNYKLHYNMGQVYVEIADYAKALNELNRYLTEGGTDVTPARKDEVRKQIDRLRSRVGQLIVETVAGAEVAIDDETVGTAPLQGPLSMSIGRHRVTVTVRGSAPVTKVVDVPGLQSITVTIGVEGGQVVASGGSSSSGGIGISTGAGSSGGPSTKVVIGLWAATGVLAVVSIGLGLATLNQSHILETYRKAFPVTSDELVAHSQKVASYALVTDVFTAAAVVMGAASLIVTVMNLTSSSSSTPVALTVGPGSVGLVGHF